MNTKHCLTWYVAHTLLAVTVIVGITVRFQDLGKWPLSVDEYYLTQSIYSILDNGLPNFECGGYYVRGILQQYITAPLLLLGADPEWALRIIPLLSNLLALPAIYLIGKRLGSYHIACLACILFSLSVWEIEFARFIRMYSPIQTIFVWFTLYLIKCISEKDLKSFRRVAFLAFLGLFVHKIAIFMVAATLIPFITRSLKFDVRNSAWLIAILVSAALLETVNFDHIGAPLDSSLDIPAGESSSPIILPPSLLPLMAQSNIAVLIFLVTITFSLYAIINLWIHQAKKVYENLFVSLSVILFAINLYGMAIIVLTASTTLGIVSLKCIYQQKIKSFPLIASIATSLLFWTAYGFIHLEEVHNFSRIDMEKYTSPYLHLMAITFNYPEIYLRIIKPWFSGMPVLTATLITIPTAALIADWKSQTESSKTFRLLISLIIIMTAFIGLINTNQHTPRYSFFIYPLMLLAFCYAAYLLIQKTKPLKKQTIAFTYTATIAFMLFTEDFNYNHITNISKHEVNFRTNYSNEIQDFYYFRRDYETPANFINKNIKHGERIISTASVVDFYLQKKLDYILIERDSNRFKERLTCKGIKDRWSNAYVIDSRDALNTLIKERGSAIWLITYTVDWKGKNDSEFTQRYKDNLVYSSTDDTINVFYLPKKESKNNITTKNLSHTPH